MEESNYRPDLILIKLESMRTELVEIISRQERLDESVCRIWMRL